MTEQGNPMMNPINLITDVYERKARLYPALLLLAPVIVTLVAVMGVKLSALQGLTTALLSCGGTFFLSQLARDAGKRGEKRLFAQWGGMPSISILRHRDTRVDSITKARYHKTMTTLVKGTKVPSPESETSEPMAADEVYSAWSTYLRVNTRDTKKFPLLFQENINYGYRRNVWGLRPLGILISGSGCLTAAVLLYKSYEAAGLKEELLGALGLNLMLLLLWLFQFSSEWVRIPADSYAERLVETVDSFAKKAAPSKTPTSKD